MAYTPKIILSPEEAAALEAASLAHALSGAEAVEKAAKQFATMMRVSGGRYRSSQSHALLDLCNAMIGLIDDGDCLAQRDSLMDELRCDEEGNPVDEDGELVGAWSSFGMHHPDSPSFGERV